MSTPTLRPSAAGTPAPRSTVERATPARVESNGFGAPPLESGAVAQSVSNGSSLHEVDGTAQGSVGQGQSGTYPADSKTTEHQLVPLLSDYVRDLPTHQSTPSFVPHQVPSPEDVSSHNIYPPPPPVFYPPPYDYAGSGVPFVPPHPYADHFNHPVPNPYPTTIQAPSFQYYPAGTPIDPEYAYGGYPPPPPLLEYDRCAAAYCPRQAFCRLAPCGCHLCREHLGSLLRSSENEEVEGTGRVKRFRCVACGAISRTAGPMGVPESLGVDLSSDGYDRRTETRMVYANDPQQVRSERFSVHYTPSSSQALIPSFANDVPYYPNLPQSYFEAPSPEFGQLSLDPPPAIPMGTPYGRHSRTWSSPISSTPPISNESSTHSRHLSLSKVEPKSEEPLPLRPFVPSPDRPLQLPPRGRPYRFGPRSSISTEMNPVPCHIEVSQWPTLKIENIPFATSVEDIERWLETFDPLPPFDSVPSPIHLICHRATGRTLPHCYVETKSLQAAKSVKIALDRGTLGDRTIRIKWERPGELLRDLFSQEQYFPAQSLGSPASAPLPPAPTAYKFPKPVLTQQEMKKLSDFCESRELGRERAWERPFLNICSIIAKFPWKEVELWGTSERDLIFDCALDAVKIAKRHSLTMVDFKIVLRKLERTILDCQEFTDEQKRMIESVIAPTPVPSTPTAQTIRLPRQSFQHSVRMPISPPSYRHERNWSESEPKRWRYTGSQPPSTPPATPPRSRLE